MENMFESIKNLREMTGAGFMDCKKALIENNNNIEKSIDYLRMKGLAKASKKSLREANEGAVGIFNNDLISVILEINTETDFAAKNEIFLNFLEEIGNFALSLRYNKDLNLDDFLNKNLDGKKVSDYFTDIISKIGENIVLRKINFISKDKDSEIYKYTHNSYRQDIGKICVLLKAEVKDNDEEAKEFGKNLCMHIAASKPLALDINELDKNLIEKEKEIQLSSIKSSGKPDNIIEKILEGKMQKFYSEVTLLNQPFIMDNDRKIKKVIEDFSSKNNFKILEYYLFVLGS